MRGSRLAVAATILVVVGNSNSASAKVVEYDCTYPKSYNASKNALEGGEEFRLQFKLDTVTNKAFLIGNMGIEEVTYVTGDEGITFLEFLASGVAQTTTISNSGASVHSRHTLMGGEFIASQFYGSCR